MTNKFFVFDVESVGLHGPAYAVGFVVVDEDGNELARQMSATPYQNMPGTPASHKWLSENAPDLISIFRTRADVRDAFWAAWSSWKRQGAVLVADCPWPVEARFLLECVQDDPEGREWEGPYPLIDVASVRLAAGLDPLATVDRLPNELPAHNPLADARQSARLLLEALQACRHG